VGLVKAKQKVCAQAALLQAVQKRTKTKIFKRFIIKEKKKGDDSGFILI
jgi:hypothetical protein